MIRFVPIFLALLAGAISGRHLRRAGSIAFAFHFIAALAAAAFPETGIAVAAVFALAVAVVRMIAVRWEGGAAELVAIVFLLVAVGDGVAWFRLGPGAAPVVARVHVKNPALPIELDVPASMPGVFSPGRAVFDGTVMTPAGFHSGDRLVVAVTGSADGVTLDDACGSHECGVTLTRIDHGVSFALTRYWLTDELTEPTRGDLEAVLDPIVTSARRP